ncbi:MAG: response regulator, partial [Acetatifactor sp.]|nr:response regulator [Acetatifactor sp.]
MKNFTRGLVLIVDDVAINRVILGEIVGSMGCKTVLAEDGVEALERIREELPNLVLTDISMPKMDGYELCRVLKSNVQTKDIPIIFISAFDNPKDIVKGFDLGGGDYIT